MYARQLEEKLRTAADKYRAIVLLGPRQSGKTTLARRAFPQFRYVSLEDPDLRSRALSDPRALLSEDSNSLIIDEVQRVPDLLSYLQAILDDPTSERRFILTGSHNLLLAERVSQTLAGRTRIFSLLPLSQRELVMNDLCPSDRLEDRLLRGGYPRIYDHELDPTEWLAQVPIPTSTIQAFYAICCASPSPNNCGRIRSAGDFRKLGSDGTNEDISKRGERTATIFLAGLKRP